MRGKHKFLILCLVMCIGLCIAGCTNKVSNIASKAQLDRNFHAATSLYVFVAQNTHDASKRTDKVLANRCNKLIKSRNKIHTSFIKTRYSTSLILYDSKVIKFVNLVQQKHLRQAPIQGHNILIMGLNMYQHFNVKGSSSLIKKAIVCDTKNGYSLKSLGIVSNLTLKKKQIQDTEALWKEEKFYSSKMVKILEAILIIASLMIIVTVWFRPSRQGIIINNLTDETNDSLFSHAKAYGFAKISVQITVIGTAMSIAILVLLNFLGKN